MQFSFVKSISICVFWLLTVPPQPPVILGLERQEVRAGTVLVLECVCQSGNPLANLQWTKVNPCKSMYMGVSEGNMFSTTTHFPRPCFTFLSCVCIRLSEWRGFTEDVGRRCCGAYVQKCPPSENQPCGQPSNTEL